ncbi:MAG: type II secretion system protein [Fimbriimonas sp.]
MIRLRRAFTLVEALLVIAILAMVGAVLFPVFSQASGAAKKATCFGNFHQVSLATMLYVGDYDDLMMPVNHQPAEVPNSRNDKTWVQLILPYMGSFAPFRCPSDRSERPRSETLFDQDLVPGDTYSQFYSASMRTNLGFNFQYLSPIVRIANHWQALPKALTSIREPARTVLFVDSVWSRDANGVPTGGGSWLVVPPCRYVEVEGVPKDTFLDRFGDGTKIFTTNRGWDPSDISSQYQFGGAWPWHEGRMTVARVDGSVVSLTPTQLAQGCDVRPEWSGRIESSAAYLWDTE